MGGHEGYCKEFLGKDFFFFIVSVMEAVQVLNRGLTVILSFLKIRLLWLLCGEWTVGG